MIPPPYLSERWAWGVVVVGGAALAISLIGLAWEEHRHRKRRK